MVFFSAFTAEYGFCADEKKVASDAKKTPVDAKVEAKADEEEIDLLALRDPFLSQLPIVEEKTPAIVRPGFMGDASLSGVKATSWCTRSAWRGTSCRWAPWSTSPRCDGRCRPS